MLAYFYVILVAVFSFSTSNKKSDSLKYWKKRFLIGHQQRLNWHKIDPTKYIFLQIKFTFLLFQPQFKGSIKRSLLVNFSFSKFERLYTVFNVFSLSKRIKVRVTSIIYGGQVMCQIINTSSHSSQHDSLLTINILFLLSFFLLRGRTNK